MNLYAILPCNAPGAEVTFILAETDEEAMHPGVYEAAHDVADIIYCSPTAEVYRIGTATKVGEAKAEDVPTSWEWAREVPARVAADEAARAALQAMSPEEEDDYWKNLA